MARTGEPGSPPTSTSCHRPGDDAAAVEPGRLDPGRLDPDRGQGLATSRTTTRSLPPETLQDIPVGSMPIGSCRSQHLREPRQRRRDRRGRRARRDRLLHGHRSAATTAPTATSRSCSASSGRRRRRCRRAPRARSRTAPARRASLPAGLAGRHEDALPLQPQRLTACTAPADTNAMLASLNCARSGGPRSRARCSRSTGTRPSAHAYTAWDATPCNVEAANNVVRADQRRRHAVPEQTPGLRYVVLLGSDDALPMARVRDRVNDLARDATSPRDLEFTTPEPHARQRDLRGRRARLLPHRRRLRHASRRSRGSGASCSCRRCRSAGSSRRPPTSSAQLKVSTSTRTGRSTAGSALTTGYDFLTDGAEATGSAAHRARRRGQRGRG